MHDVRSGLWNLPSRPRSTRLLLLAAADRDGLRRCIERVERKLARQPESPSPMTADRHGEGTHRLAIVGADREQLAANLVAAKRELDRDDVRRLSVPSGIYAAEAPERPGRTAFLFPGQGSQHEGMLADLCVAFPALRAWLAQLDDAVADLEPQSLTALAYPPPDLSDDERRSLPSRLLGLDGGAQLAFIAGIALHELLEGLGLTADAMLGHSSGEHAALVASGTFRIPDRPALFEAARTIMIAARRLPVPPVPEASLAVAGFSRTRLAELLDEYRGSLYLAMDNCPSQVVLAGHATAIDAVAARIRARGGICIRLPFEWAYHTPLFDEWRRRLLDVYHDAAAGRGRVPLYSCATAAPYPDDPDAARALAASQWSTVVRFGDTIERLYADGYRTFLEVGPGNKLTGFVRDILRGRPHVAVSACNSARGDLEQLHHLAAELFVNGYTIDADRWCIGKAERVRPEAGTVVEHHFSLLRELVASQDRVFTRLGQAIGHERPWRLERERVFDVHRTDPVLRDHSLGRLAVVPFTMSLDLAAEAGRQLFGDRAVLSITNASAYRWLALDQGRLQTTIVAEPTSASEGLVQIFEVGEGGRRVLSFEARVSVAPHTQVPPRSRRDAASPVRWTADRFYADYAFHGPLFQGIRDVESISGDSIQARLRVTPAGAPALLDCAGQLVGLWLLEQDRRDFGIFPFRLRSLRRFEAMPVTGTDVFARATVRWNERGMTDADVELFDAGGAPVYRLEGFEQRYLPMPPPFARLLFGSARGDVDLDGVPRSFFSENWGIWGRTLAHLVLERDELAEWYAREHRDEAIDRLLARCAAGRTVNV